MKKDTPNTPLWGGVATSNDTLVNAIKYDNKLNDLWHSNSNGAGGNESETDLDNFCNKLA